MPGEVRAPVSEAWGVTAALHLLASRPLRGRTALVAGDNLGVVRFGAGTGRLHHSRLQTPVAAALSRVLLLGWRLRWAAVRRGFNTSADAEATIARERAAVLHAAGQAEAEWHVEWFDAP